MNQKPDAAEDRTPATNVAVIVADENSAKAAQAAGITEALCITDIAAADAEDLASKLEGVDATVILIPAEKKKGEGKKHPAWSLARALREVGAPATGWYCKGTATLAQWVEKDGVDRVRQALDQAAARAVSRTTRKSVGGYVAVGYDGDHSIVWSIPRQALKDLGPRDFGDAMLQTVCGASWCQEHYTVTSARGTTKLDLAQLRAEIIDACRDAGPCSAKDIRGAGCWRVAPGVLAVNSETLWRTDGQPVERVGQHSVYPISKGLGLLSDTPEASDAEAAEVLKLLSSWNWASQSDPILLLGWIAQAAVVGALDRRPHLMVTGARGAGKTTLLDCVFRLLGSSGLKADGGSTAAGLRQRLKHDARVVLLDEFESKSDREAMRVRALIEQMRSAYSDGVGDGVLRGTADGVGTSYAVRYSALCSMIVPPAMEAADRTRFAQLDLLPLDRGVKIPALALDEASLAELGKKLRMRMIRHYADIVDSVAAVRDALIAKGHSPRLGDTLGGLLGAAYVLLNGQAIVDEFDIRIWIKEADLDDHAATVETASDEDECVAWMLGASVRIYDDTLTVAEAVQGALDEIAGGEGRKGHTTGKALERVGVKVYADSIAVVRGDFEGLRSIFRNSKFADGGWSVVLARLPNAREAVVRVGGVNTRVVQIPLDSIKALALEPKQHDLGLHSRTDKVVHLRAAEGAL